MQNVLNIINSLEIICSDTEYGLVIDHNTGSWIINTYLLPVSLVTFIRENSNRIHFTSYCSKSAQGTHYAIRRHTTRYIMKGGMINDLPL